MDYNDASAILEQFCTGNADSYSSAAFDAAVEASRTGDRAAHFAALHDAERILMEDCAVMPIVYYADNWLQSPSLKGVWHSPYGYWYLQYAYAA